MNFKIVANPTFNASVPLHIPGGENESITLVFKHKRMSELKAFAESITEENVIDKLMEIVAGWIDVDADFSRDNLAIMLDNYAGAGIAIMNAYVDELRGAREGN